MKKTLLITLFSAGLLTALLSQPVLAWPHRKNTAADEAAKKVQTFQAPNPDAVKLYCEPYRKEAFDLSQVHFMAKPFVMVHRNYLIRQHRKCLSDLMSQEYQYLKHVDVEQSPSLPKLANPAADAKPSTDGEDGHAKQ